MSAAAAKKDPQHLCRSIVQRCIFLASALAVAALPIYHALLILHISPTWTTLPVLVLVYASLLAALIIAYQNLAVTKLQHLHQRAQSTRAAITTKKTLQPVPHDHLLEQTALAYSLAVNNSLLVGLFVALASYFFSTMPAY